MTTHPTERPHALNGLALVTAEIAHHVLWHYGNADGNTGLEPGSFTRALLAAIARADLANRSRLRAGFPGYVIACDLIEADSQGVEVLRAIARSREGTTT